MKTNMVETSGACRVLIQSSEHRTFTDYRITATVDGPMPAGAAADELFSQVASALVSRKIQPIQEKVYGLTRARANVLSRRDSIYRQRGLDRTMPVTWIQGDPLQGCDFVGLQLWGVAPSDGEACVTTVESPASGRAREWRGQGFRMLHLPSVRGTTPTGWLAEGRASQAREMFLNVERGLRDHDLAYTDVVRTWIYSSRLLEWYPELNAIRTGIYRGAGLGVDGGPEFPASTGIMGHSDDEECVMDVLALRSDDPECARATAIRRSPRQDSSFNYGSSFSRGMAIEIEGRTTVHISGTASINTAGMSTHAGDAEHQSLETLLSISAILAEQGGSLGDITSATLFCKTKEAWEAWDRATRLLGIPSFPRICMIADVCRDDLLVEMEAVALI